MEILDADVQRDLDAQRPLAIDLGSGGKGRDGCYGLDFLGLPGVAIKADLNQPLDALPDNSVSRLTSSHCLEHIENFIPLMRELHRVVRADGVIEVTVPHFSNPFGYSDPTHVRFFGLYTFNYFVSTEDQPARKVPCYYSDIRFKLMSIRITLMPRTLLKRLMHPGWGSKINQSSDYQDEWERGLCWVLPASEITYCMAPVKP